MIPLHNTWSRTGAALLVSLLAASCGGGGGGTDGGDDTPPAPPIGSRITATFPLAQATTVTGDEGAVEASAQVRITNVDATARQGTTVQVVAQATADGAFQATLPAQLGDALDVVAIDAAGNESAATRVTAGPAPASVQILLVGDDPQTGVSGRPLPDPLQVKVTGAPPHTELPGLAVLFEVQAGGGQLSSQRVVTDAQGIAKVNYTLGPGLGENEVVARLELFPEKQATLRANGVGPPRVDGVEPAQAMPGDTVEIQGANFSPIGRHNTVLFGGEKATVVEASATRLEVEVAPFSTEGPVSVTLTGVSSNALDFTVVPALVEAPPVGSVVPVSLLAGDGRVILSFEDASTEYVLVLQSMKPTAAEFTASIRGVGVTLAARGALAGAAAPQALPTGEAWIRELDRWAARNLPRPEPGVIFRPLVPAQDLGSTRQFWVVNKSGPIIITDPNNFDRVTAVLRYKGENTLLYVDQRTPATLTDAMIQQIGDRFDDQSYPTDVAAFGATSDIDGNGRVMILLSPTVNSLTTQEIVDQGARIVGFFFGIDLQPHPTLNPHANNGEVFYAVVPDPDRTFGAARVTVEEIVGLLASVFAHELEHMISFNHHVLVVAGQAESLWLDESLAHMAETINDLHTQNMLRSAFFLQSPEATTLVGGGDALDERGAGWLFVHYLVDRFGEQILNRMVAGAQGRRGITNVDAATDVAFNFMFHEWASTLYLDGPEVPNDARFESSLNLRADFASAKQILNSSPTQPPRITGEYLDVDVANLPEASLSVTQKGTSPAYVLVGAKGRANAPVDIDGESGSELQVTVIRVK